jgi:hypothetical protein
MLFGIALSVGSSIDDALADLPRGGLRLAGDTGSAGTNPYGSAIMYVRVAATATEREDVVSRVRELQQRYGFSWDGSVFQDQASHLSGFDDFAIRIALDRRAIPELAREAGVVKVVLIGRYAF